MTFLVWLVWVVCVFRLFYFVSVCLDLNLEIWCLWVWFGDFIVFGVLRVLGLRGVGVRLDYHLVEFCCLDCSFWV